MQNPIAFHPNEGQLKGASLLPDDMYLTLVFMMNLFPHSCLEMVLDLLPTVSQVFNGPAIG
jgi:hypothetical protein